MADSYKPYLQSIKDGLMKTLCLRNFPSQKFEKINRPQVEVEENAELVNKPIEIKRSEDEKTLIESSINSVRVSVVIKKHQDLEKLLVGIYTKFLMNRANKLNLLRKVAREGYDISFLITNFHLEFYKREELVDFIVEFVQDYVKEITDMKLIVNSQSRFSATHFMEQVQI